MPSPRKPTFQIDKSLANNAKREAKALKNGAEDPNADILTENADRARAHLAKLLSIRDMYAERMTDAMRLDGLALENGASYYTRDKNKKPLAGSVLHHCALLEVLIYRMAINVKRFSPANNYGADSDNSDFEDLNTLTPDEF